MSGKGSNQLNQAQADAVSVRQGPVLVVAGAGTGKTRVIVERISSLIDEGVAPRSILALTFTEKAAAEMLDRILERRQELQPELPIMTFNGFGESLLREFNTEIGLSRSFRLLGDSAQLVFLRQYLERLKLEKYSPVSNPEGLLPDIAEYFSRLKQHVVTAEVYEVYTAKLPSGSPAEAEEKARHQELARAFKNYQALCQQMNVIDYDDQIYRTIELLTKQPHVLKKLRERYQYIMVDEFQDTNPMQSHLIDLLSGEKQNLMVVGDDDQSIYGFRGATLSNILDFKKRYPGAQEITLNENYRSSQEILESAYRLIQHNNPERLEAKLGINKQLTAQFHADQPRPICFESLDLELAWLVDDILSRLKNGEQPGSIAVLCRRNLTATRVSQALELANIDHVFIGETYKLYETPVVRMLIEALKAITDPAESTSLYHTLSSPLFQLEPHSLASLATRAKRSHMTLEDQITVEGDSIFKSALSQIRTWRTEAGIISVGRLVYKVIDDTGYRHKLLTEAANNPEAAQAITYLSDFFASLKEFESIAVQPTAIAYVEAYPVLQAAAESTLDNSSEVAFDKINVLTIHKAKGLEWDSVYIPDCTEGSFPLRSRPVGLQIPPELIEDSLSAADDHIAEERRLMYVAVTRAKQNLYLSYSKRHHTPTPRKLSRFLSELFGEIDENIYQIKPQASGLPQFLPPTLPKANVQIPTEIFDGKNVRLSVSQITTFLNCPLDFYYRFVLGVPEPPSFAAQYGSTMHCLIERINSALRDEKEIELDELETELNRLWRSEGYLSKSHAEKAKTQALKTLRQFYQRHVIEESVKPELVEWPFSVKIDQLVIKGRLDAVFISEKGSEIRDYKTGLSTDTPEKAKRRTTASQQLTLYALVWQELNTDLPTKLSLEFVDTGVVGEVKKTTRSIDTMHTKLSQVIEAIKNSHFEPGSDHTYCLHPPL